MPDATFCTWHAETLTILEYIPEIAPLKQRFIDVGRNNNSIADKIKEVRGILFSVVKRINSPLFGTGAVPTDLLPIAKNIIFSPNMTQTLTQPINVSLNTILQRVDDVQGISDENKEEAKTEVKNIWDHITSGANNSAKLFDSAAKLANLGFTVQELFRGLFS